MSPNNMSLSHISVGMISVLSSLEGSMYTQASVATTPSSEFLSLTFTPLPSESCETLYAFSFRLVETNIATPFLAMLLSDLNILYELMNHLSSLVNIVSWTKAMSIFWLKSIELNIIFFV